MFQTGISVIITNIFKRLARRSVVSRTRLIKEATGGQHIFWTLYALVQHLTLHRKAFHSLLYQITFSIEICNRCATFKAVNCFSRSTKESPNQLIMLLPVQRAPDGDDVSYVLVMKNSERLASKLLLLQTKNNCIVIPFMMAGCRGIW